MPLNELNGLQCSGCFLGKQSTSRNGYHIWELECGEAPPSDVWNLWRDEHLEPALTNPAKPRQPALVSYVPRHCLTVLDLDQASLSVLNDLKRLRIGEEHASPVTAKEGKMLDRELLVAEQPDKAEMEALQLRHPFTNRGLMEVSTRARGH